MDDTPINAGHPTEGDPVMEEYYEAKAAQIASDIAARRARVDNLLDEGEETDDGTADDGLDAASLGPSPLSDVDELTGRVRRLVELRARRDETKLASDKAKAEFEQFQAEFFEEYEKSPLKGSVKVDVGGSTVQIVPRKTKYARILDRDKAVEALRKAGLLKSVQKEDFRMGRLHEIVRQSIESKQPIPDGLDFYTKEYFTITVKD